MENNKFLFLKNNNFVYFSHPKSIKTFLNKDGIEKKKLPFDKTFSWTDINKDNYKDFVNDDDKTFFIITGKESNVTVIDFDDADIYDTLVNTYPDLKANLTVKTNKGYHIYFTYESQIKTTTNINGLDGIDARNDNGLIIAPPTKYKLLDGSKAQYKYLYGDLLKMPDFLLKQLITKEEVTEKPKKEMKRKEIPLNDGKTKAEFIERLIDILDDSRADDRTEWNEISFVINNELGKKEGLPLFKCFSKRSDKYEGKKDDDWFKSTNTNEKGLYIGTLMKKAKEDDPEAYEELRTEFIKKEFINKSFQILEYEQDIAQYIIDKYLKNNYVCVSYDPNEEFYYYNGNIWSKDHSNITIWNYITIDYVKELTDYKMTITKEDDKEEYKALLRVLAKLKGKASGPNSIINLIGHILFNPKFYDLCDENIYLLGFNNGVYDTRTKEFRDGKPDDYITKSVGFDFPKEYSKYKDDLDKFFLQIYPSEQVRNYALQQQAQSISGKKGKDIIYTHTGRGGNGKSILQDLIKHSFGDYYVEIPSTMLTKVNKMEHNKPDPFFSELKGCRMATSNEPSDGSSINDSFFKLIASKEGMKYRTLFSKVVEKLKIQFQLNIYCNNKLNFNAEDGGVVRRLKVVDYISKFDETPNEQNNIYKIDYDLSEKVKNWKQDYMLLLLNLYNPDYKYIEPDEIKDSSSKYADSNNDVKKFLNQHYTQTNNNNDFIVLKDIKSSYQQNKEYDQSKLKNLSESLQKIMATNLKERHKHKGKNYYSVFIGWKLNEDLEESETEKSSLDI